MSQTTPTKKSADPGGTQLDSPFKRARLEDDEPRASQSSEYRIDSVGDGAIIEAARKRERLLIESPTGSGKTMSLIIGALEALNGNGTSVENKPERLIFCSRTHSQLQQTISEMRRAGFLLKDFRHTILASRKNYCTNSKVATSTGLNTKCRALVNHKQSIKVDGADCKKFCPMWENFQKAKEKPNYPSQHEGSGLKTQKKTFREEFVDTKVANQLWNVEDLKTALSDKMKNYQFDLEDSPFYSRNCTVLLAPDPDGPKCPYYASRQMIDDAQIVFAPYNYVMNPTIRKISFGSMGLRRALLVIDEAHNIENLCREEASFGITDLSILETLETIDKADERLAIALRGLEAPFNANLKNVRRALNDLKIYATNFLKWLIAKGKQKFGETRQPSNLTDYKMILFDLQDSQELNLRGILLSSIDLADFQVKD
ncbi:unnamed protein product, partial [Mesorhabditis belari]|uniref:Helicase ATP-binding domain-containing protein n=1 Tax=Mesorhabditis belari TaxID=2138241 RepID=A0AAF3EPD0_9BILA